MKLEDLGYNNNFETLRVKQKLDDFEIGRIRSEHKERYIVMTQKGDFEAEITGNMQYTAKSREDFPAVGDWVALATYGSNLGIIHKVLPRFSVIKRQAVGHVGEVQIIATNIDYAFLIQSVDRDFNINRLERYLTICNSSHVTPIIVLTKTDLVDEKHISEIKNNPRLSIKKVLVLALSNETKYGYETLISTIKKGKTYCMLGSSGVGKSTLLNNLSGRNIMETGSISQSSNRGKHVSSHRELIVLKNGGILIDTPGMREIGITDAVAGIETTFDEIMSLSEKCKFRDCTHTTEIGCSVLKALEEGRLEIKSYENYLKLQREQTHFESAVAKKRKADKAFGKMIKIHKKMKNRNKY
ncbi:ribosome small subunit-dependent GTPase A [Flavivirga algicola]|uniref:Small ribosomal subunit biogenesis GTPase RsgA n=1 Tax=Flavivirga algicola TaxID=2729136 RepID=A0ABX1RZP9_9FLAO|nr:ribosome small subunit-dependent GTPase A [Flavivirga algicola]NMH89067.1 ribosome small subunit-dependent GTPase A [Flavivirga algicola]